MSRGRGCLAAIFTLLALFPGASARAAFGPADLLSGTGSLQFDEANAPALSQDGDFVAFEGTLAGASGIYERNLSSGTIETVVSGIQASAPSISGDGRYVAFTTTTDLNPSEEPQEDSGCPEVYVRDMWSVPAANAAEESISPSTAYTLASAVGKGSGEGIAFAPVPGAASGSACPVPANESFADAGAQAAPGGAISADGHRVVFTVLSPSNLSGQPTPPSQVAVRDLETETTTLVSAGYGSAAPTEGGGAFPSSQSERVAAVNLISTERGELSYGDQLSDSTAVISADGTTVAWLGTNVASQVADGAAVQAELSGCPHPGAASEVGAAEVEPLWRRIEDGPGAVTRRLLAGAGLDLCFTAETANESDPATSGSFVGEQRPVFVPPAISDNGETVAVIANAPTPTAESSLTAINGRAGAPNTDAYSVQVNDSAAPPIVRALTATPDYAAGVAAIGDVKDVAVALDGTRVAFDTTRTQFVLPTLALISPASIFSEVEETYQADLATGTLQRVSVTYNGSSPNKGNTLSIGGAGLLSLSGQDGKLAFASTSSNLFYGDGVPTEQVYLAQEEPEVSVVAPQVLGPPAIAAPPTPEWTLSVTAASQRDGTARLYAEVPAAGELAVGASAQLSSSRKGRATHVSLLSRTVAHVQKATKGAGEVMLNLRVDATYLSRVHSATGLFAHLTVTFSAKGHAKLTRIVPITFRAQAAKKDKKKGPSKVSSRAKKTARKSKKPSKPAGRAR